MHIFFGSYKAVQRIEVLENERVLTEYLNYIIFDRHACKVEVENGGLAGLKIDKCRNAPMIELRLDYHTGCRLYIST